MFSCMFHVSPKGTVEENFEVLSNKLFIKIIVFD